MVWFFGDEMVLLMMMFSVDRDCARWKLSPAEVQKRRALFWELFITDGWQVRVCSVFDTFSFSD